MLLLGEVGFPMAEAIWNNGATLKAKIFMWLAIQGRLWTSDRRHRHGLQDHASACFVCLQEWDTVEHLFTQCVYAREVWQGCFQRLRITATGPSQVCTLEEWWSRTRVRFAMKHRKNFDAVVILVCWSIWKNRNAWAFNNPSKQFQARALINSICDEFAMWVLARRGVSGVFGAVT